MFLSIEDSLHEKILNNFNALVISENRKKIIQNFVRQAIIVILHHIAASLGRLDSMSRFILKIRTKCPTINQKTMIYSRQTTATTSFYKVLKPKSVKLMPT